MSAETFAKGDRLMRQRRIEQLLGLHPQGWTAAGLADELGVSKRTIQRDIAALSSELHVPIKFDRDRYTVMDGYYLKQVNLTVTESVGLLMAARLTARFADRAMPFLASAYEKIAVALNERSVKAAVAGAAEDLRSRRPDQRVARVFSNVAAAWAGRRKLRLTYSQPREFTRVVWPLLVDASLAGHVAYLVAWEEKRGVPRAYRLDRVIEARVLDESFDPPLGFTVDAMLEHAWGIWAPEGAPVDVELLFSAAVAERVKETEWHRSQRLEIQSDGRVRMLLTVGSTTELKPWILGWGREVEVVAPGAFREELAADLRAAAGAYQRSPSAAVKSPPIAMLEQRDGRDLTKTRPA